MKGDNTEEDCEETTVAAANTHARTEAAGPEDAEVAFCEVKHPEHWDEQIQGIPLLRLAIRRYHVEIRGVDDVALGVGDGCVHA